MDKPVLFSVGDPYSASFAGYYLKNKVYEPEAVEVLLQYLKQEDVFVDVGANIGYFTLVMAVHVPGIPIIAFEMGNENVKILKRNIELNNLKGVEVVECAVTDRTSAVYCTDSAVGNAVLKIIEEKCDNNPDVVQVNAVSLDDFFADRTSKPTFVKIDVEGAEMKVLQGMKTLLQNEIKLLIEMHPKSLLEFGSNREEVLDFLQQFSYNTRLIPTSDRKNELVFSWK